MLVIQKNFGISRKNLGIEVKRKKAVMWFWKLMVKLVLTLKGWQIALIISLLLLLQTWLTNCLLVLVYFTQSSTFQFFLLKMFRMMNLC